jgi:hypothetical protein
VQGSNSAGAKTEGALDTTWRREICFNVWLQKQVINECDCFQSESMGGRCRTLLVRAPGWSLPVSPL